LLKDKKNLLKDKKNLLKDKKNLLKDKKKLAVGLYKLENRIETLEKKMDKGFQKQGDINGTVVEYVLRQILKEEYPIIANTTEKLVEILKDVGLTITSKSIPNFSELIGDFVKEADVKKKRL